ncbi:Lrp/AsnC family transcriptional regulator [Granulosicoccaceae sp. 1_MG-2023]|nr:Lrp/AsnC family transcriptional regulator [Granulosicoccaceae sp. 1_MG-2023]
MKTDRTDRHILKVLQRDGRLSKVRLAEEVNLSTSPAWERVKRLEEAGIITGYHAAVDFKKLTSLTRVKVEIVLKHHRREDFARFENLVMSIDEIVCCEAVGGGVDYILTVLTRDIDCYQRLIDELLQAEPGIDRYYSYIVTKTIKDDSRALMEQLLDELPD